MTDDAREQREYEQQEFMRRIVADLHYRYVNDHLRGFAVAASAILQALADPARAPKTELWIAAMLDRIRKFARSDAEHSYLLGQLLMQIVNSISIEVGRAHALELIR